MQKQWEIMMRIDIDFDSKKTAFVQGIAVLMMLSLHFFIIHNGLIVHRFGMAF